MSGGVFRFFLTDSRKSLRNCKYKLSADQLIEFSARNEESKQSGKELSSVGKHLCANWVLQVNPVGQVNILTLAFLCCV